MSEEYESMHPVDALRAELSDEQDLSDALLKALKEISNRQDSNSRVMIEIARDAIGKAARARKER